MSDPSSTANDAASDRVAPAPPQGSTFAWTTPVIGERAGDMVGPYKLLSVLGEGGFGVVYLAERREPIVQRVALKIIKPGMDSRAVIARFEQERQALAIMDHPNVAKVFDAGATAGGRPFFVMELVQGEPITAYCDRHSLTIKQRLELFIPVCEAVQHAHTKGIIHRDIKPSNILVSIKDERPIPKVIDLGVAKAISHALTDKTIFTEHGQIIGTPEYMSPEQAEMGAIDIDTRTDIYSLGVVLYEMMTGVVPFDPKVLRSKGYGEIQRIIREDEPPKPSTRISSLGEVSTTYAEKRRIDRRSLERELRGDLAWITMKAIDKDRTRRYTTATDLAGDIERHLSNQPVLAGPPSGLYRLQKFVRRNRTGVLAAGVVVAALLAATWVSVLFGLRERQARLAETRQRQIAQTTISFLQDDLLLAADPDHDGPDIKVIDILDRAAETMTARFAHEPAIEAPLQRTMGSAYLAIGAPAQAQPCLERARALHAQLEPGNADLLREIDLPLAESMWRNGQSDKAIALMQSVVEALKAEKGIDAAPTLHAMNQFANACKWANRLDQAAALYDEVLERRMTTLGPRHADTLISRKNRVLVEIRRGGPMVKPERDEQERLRGKAILEKALTDIRAIHIDAGAALGADDEETLAAASEVASLLNRLDRYDEAEAQYVETLERMRAKLGPRHWRTLEALANYGRLLEKQNRLVEATTVYQVALEGYRIRRGPAFGNTITLANWLAKAYESLERFDQSRELLVRTYNDLSVAQVEQNRLWEQAEVVRQFFSRRGDRQAEAHWAALCKPAA
jgi:serine/threonine protein kinase/tetratricopeptide (TPR) repeat protein